MEDYTSDSSDTDNQASSRVLDFSYLLLDSATLCHNLEYTADDETSNAESIETLLLYHNELTTFPESILRFQYIKILDISANNISRIPETISHLIHLISLIARSNSLDDDAFPKNFAMLRSLRELNLSGNNLTTFPSAILALTGLKYLYVGSNRITTIPKDIGLMNKLQVLYLGGNLLSIMPAEIGQLECLRALVLCENQLQSLPPTVANLRQLKSLLLHKNRLTTLPPEIIALQNLMELSLRDNPLVVRFVRDMTYDPPSLLELAARSVKYQNVPYNTHELPANVIGYLDSAHHCVNPKCKGVYFDNRVEHIKFVDFCGKYRIPLLQYLCSPQCSENTTLSADAEGAVNNNEERLKKVLLG